ncbi:hypothetical protein TrLO_g2861 [Triparma laevis f. longispina]|uniref:Uncharacterized protein n=1 Tax=Triparma laevis f. longispina TaxID=1714387 RepID=A0A9W7F8D1_9STRA|nr:hypothetical protein TrLO_g2861 [Triparma laevis f. longispina]
MATDDFRRLMRGYVDVAELFHAFRLVIKLWQRIAEEEIDREFESGVLAFHDGSDVSAVVAFARKERRKLVMRVTFLLNIIQNDVVIERVDKVVESGKMIVHGGKGVNDDVADARETLKLIGDLAFLYCTSLENVDLLHMNLRELGQKAFDGYDELKLVTIPDLLQKLGGHIFENCFKLVPHDIDPASTTR